MNVDAHPRPATAAEAEWVAVQRRWSGSWRRLIMAAIPLAYLAFLVPAVTQNSRGAGRIAGYAILAAFAACWLAAPLLSWPDRSLRGFWPYCSLLAALFVAELPFARAAGFVLCLFLTILIVARLGVWSVPVVAGFALAALLVPVAIGSWHVSLQASFGDVTPVAIPVAAPGEADPARALGQIAEVEDVSRRALAEVRAAVSGYRDVTLAGELARGRELLRAAGVAADLPAAADMVDPAHQQLLGWVVREGLTNVIRHSRARTCAVRLSPAAVEIINDGVGVAAPPGNGLRGLRERVTAAGGTVDAGPLQPAGWRLRVSLAPEGDT